MSEITECDMFICKKLADGSWRIHYRTEFGVYPDCEYPTAKKMLSRMAQLLDTGPFNPQCHPEHIGIKL